MKRFVMPLITNKELLPVYVYTVGGMENQSPIDREDGYSEFIWLHTIKGKGKLIVDGTEYTMKADMGILLYPETAHRYYAVEEPWETHWVAFNGFGVRALLQLAGMNGTELFYRCNTRLLERHLYDIFTAAIGGHADIGLTTSARLYSFLTELPACVKGEQEGARFSTGGLLEQALTYMERHYASNFSLDEMAAAIGISHQYVCRIFNQTMRMTPGAYLTRLRLQKAKELLIGGDGSVAETGRQAGFQDSSYFCRLFRQHEGVTPLEYRKKYR